MSTITVKDVTTICYEDSHSMCTMQKDQVTRACWTFSENRPSGLAKVRFNGWTLLRSRRKTPE